MSPQDQKDLADLIAQADAVEAAIQQAVCDALREHKRAGNPVAGWENGRVIWVQPEQIQVEPLASKPA
ncbi:MAG TPA: hypothetical protein VMM76_21370 [Pirellulaceae bacterium]|nr:hypothetical protein [Pirellulaceae bacterium]